MVQTPLLGITKISPCFDNLCQSNIIEAVFCEADIGLTGAICCGPILGSNMQRTARSAR